MRAPCSQPVRGAVLSGPSTRATTVRTVRADVPNGSWSIRVSSTTTPRPPASSSSSGDAAGPGTASSSAAAPVPEPVASPTDVCVGRVEGAAGGDEEGRVTGVEGAEGAVPLPPATSSVDDVATGTLAAPAHPPMAASESVITDSRRSTASG